MRIGHLDRRFAAMIDRYRLTGIPYIIGVLLWLLEPHCGYSQEPRLLPGIDVRHATFEPPGQHRSEALVANEALAPFYWGVASGDPTSSRIVLWTRAVDATQPSFDVQWRIARDPNMVDVVEQGTSRAIGSEDYHVKVEVNNLLPGTTYYYDFEALGKRSVVGRTRTLPTDSRHVRLAVVSCSNYPSGYFNAYAAIAARNDLDLVVHLGDYIYEYGADSASYGGRVGAQLGRLHEPSNEVITLSDYRARYAQYRLDPDLQELHRQHPFVHVWDDHESANNSYTQGAQNHQPGEGSWNERMAISKQVCLEWMPTRIRPSDPVYRSFAFGSLVDLFMIDTRLDGRDKQIENIGPNAPQASIDSLVSPDRRMMSDAQFNWLTGGLRTSNATWKLIGNQVMFSPVVTEPIDTTYLFEAVGPLFALFLRPQLPTLQNLMTTGFNADTWGNYPAQRERLVDFLRQNDVRNVVIATGDFHASFAFNVPFTMPSTNGPVAVEFITPSVTSPNFDENFSSVPAVAPITVPLLETLNRTLYGNNPSLKQVDLTNHGYVLLDFTPTAVQSDFFVVDTLFIRSRSERFGFGWHRDATSDTLVRSATAARGKDVQDVPAPPVTSVDQHLYNHAPVVLSVSPNPASEVVSVTWSVAREARLTIDVIDALGRVVASSLHPFYEPGVHTAIIDVSALPSGAYTIRLADTSSTQSAPLVIRR